jgi:hypothetical protein
MKQHGSRQYLMLFHPCFVYAVWEGNAVGAAKSKILSSMQPDAG